MTTEDPPVAIGDDGFGGRTPPASPLQAPQPWVTLMEILVADADVPTVKVHSPWVS